MILNNIAKSLREQRFNKGALSFDRVEVGFNLNDKNEPKSIKLKESKQANKLVEEFMLLANKKVADLIQDAYNQGVNKLIIVTGKGLHSENEKDPYISNDLGILKHSVPDYIQSNDELMSMISEIKEANIEDGGSGAFYIFLKKNKSTK